ncbi:cytochrome (ubi)quinol oxidase subunit III [Hydrogenibacillus schlegelii]|uniref:Cytochrome (Ubi)quinol oxidase subunit III n=1 Tax=Hydrogenibacillus schlegelii TaxID=1484 RepID=A0A132MGW5_HYDSH|nr:cytochrome (ubi)quinol oxidase subunit III [Hydrogenibacillus schlegelii]KWW97082.1 cytochrome B oxidoreductase [Hydrogenibacillus schlegelii]MBT9281627.1 cytochrome (ubi)quinol oxidase subunit III [Hydrogenibacillus schlegelii]OAR03412.1 cytochrome B oxidoreductase [Hydrogenibacillus schlegelii]PTQ53964.1 MAG: Cytochrome c oxidase polypeptide III [Hydrogenibacillus schlegelii]
MSLTAEPGRLGAAAPAARAGAVEKTEAPPIELATQEGRNKLIGMWLFIAAESVLFASFFAVYLALRHSTMGGPTGKELFDLKLVFLATALLLSSSFTSVMAVLNMRRLQAGAMKAWLLATWLLGASFLALEAYEFNHYVHMGHTFTSSAFGTAFYSLVGFHGAHVTFGLLWLFALLVRNLRREVTPYIAPKVYAFSLYWHFVDLVWVFIFSVVYLMGKVA